MENVPWFLPGAGLSLFVGVILAPAAARMLSTGRVAAGLLIVTLGLIASATLTPLHGVFETGVTPGQPCDFTRVGLAPLAQLLQVDDVSLNVVLFVPLGLAITIIPFSWWKLAVLLWAVMLPFAIETIQLLAPVLGRGCESADVFDNLTGLVAGLAIGTVGRRVMAAIGAQRHMGSRREMG